MECDCVEKMINAVTPDASLIVCKRNFIVAGCPTDLKAHFLGIVRTYNMETIFPKETHISASRAANAFLDNLIVNFVGEPTAVMLNRNVFDRFGMFNTHLIQYCDLEYWIRVATNTGLIYVPEPLVYFRLHSGGTTAANGNSRKFRIFVDKLICYHEMVFHPAYEQLRHIAAHHAPPINLRQIFASELNQVRKMAVDVSRNNSRSGERQFDELDEVTQLFPAFRLIKKIPLSISYDRFKWKLRELLLQPESQ
jgi:hypothetical protein